MRRNWNQLDANLRQTCSNLAKMRIGLAAFILFIPLRIITTAISDGPAGAAAATFSLLTLVSIAISIGGVLLMMRRARDIAPAAINEYAEILPDDAPAIRDIYATRGAADMLAPWIRTPPGIIGKMLKSLGRRFNPLPRP